MSEQSEAAEMRDWEDQLRTERDAAYAALEGYSEGTLPEAIARLISENQRLLSRLADMERSCVGLRSERKAAEGRHQRETAECRKELAELRLRLSLGRLVRDDA